MDIADASALLEGRLAAVRAAHDIPGIAFGLVLAGSLVHSGGLGTAADHPDFADAPFRIASMTKSFTAATVLRLRDAGLLSLDAPVAEILPWSAGIGLPASAPPLRVQHLLTMTAGFPTDDPWGDRQESLPLADFDALVAGGLTFTRVPGLAFEYANIAYALLGRVISAVTGDDYRDVVRTGLLDPLGMTRSVFDVDRADGRMIGWHPTATGLVEQPEVPPGAFTPMGGLWSTVGDIARWVGFLESSWSDDPAEGPLSRWSRREMQRAHVVVGIDQAGAVDSYGLGLRISDTATMGRFVHHSGGYPGFGSHMRWHPDTRWGVIALANRTYAPVYEACASALTEIVADDAHDAARQRAIDQLWPETVRAMEACEGLLVEWDDTLLDGLAAMNLDLDQARADRRSAWQALGVGEVRREASSIAPRSPAHVRWHVETDRGPVDMDVLLTGERPPRIQAMTARLKAVARDQG